jgi:hypothetical protein
MKMACRMLFHDRQRALFIGLIPGAHPQQQTAIIDLVVQISGVVVPDPARKRGTDEPAGPASQYGNGDRCGKRPPDITTAPTATVAPR